MVLGVLDAGDEARRVVVAQVLANSGQVVLHRDAERLQECRRTDARDLQELRRVHRAAAQDQLPRRARTSTCAPLRPPLR